MQTKMRQNAERMVLRFGGRRHYYEFHYDKIRKEEPRIKMLGDL